VSYVLAFLGFAMLIVLHEGGHFLAAKAVGMRVERFSLFFGPMVLKRRIGETDYGLGVIPLGGYVKITGMSSVEVLESEAVEARAYHNQPVWKRIVVIAAGPAMNLLVAFVLAWVFFMLVTHDVTTKSGQPVYTTNVAGIIEGTPAAGTLHLGDRIISVDGVRGGAQTLHDEIAKHTCAGGAKTNGCVATSAAKLVVRRGGRLVTLEVKPRWSTAQNEMLVGFEFGPKTASNGVIYSLGQGAAGLWRVTKATVTDIVELFKPKDRQKLHSIVGAYEYTQQQIASGFTDGIQILALISLSLAIINLFPFLPLDGGHIFWALAEKMHRRKIAPMIVERASFVGIALIALLLFIGLSNDINTIANGGFSVH
jgi:regulator of sigma E protease